MDYYNQITQTYLYHLKHDHNYYKIKLELLSEYENVIGEIVKYVSITAQGQINIEYNQITRRSCSLSLINVQSEFTPNQNKWFWIDRKFKLWLGMSYGDDTWWFANGVYVTTSATGDTHNVQIEAVDKGGILDGTLKRNLLDGKIVVQKDISMIKDVFARTLLVDVYNKPIDPIEPIIDTFFETVPVEADIEINDGEYIASLFTTIGESYGADIWYDVNGRFTVQKLVDRDRINGYEYMGSQYDFDLSNALYGQSSIDYGYECYNAVTVFTNINAKDADGNPIENVSYTAYNKNPMSPINVSAIGVRRMDSIEINWINGLDKQEMTNRCRDVALYNLSKNSMPKLSINFTSAIIPHLDVNRTITITDEYKELDAEKFVVNSITIPLSADSMSISATSIKMLPITESAEKGVV